MNDIIPLTYEEIDSHLLEATLASDGMVFIRLSSRQSKAFIKLTRRGEVIENYKRIHPNWFIRQFNLAMAVIALLKAFLFHMRLIELESFKTITKVRCTWEVQTNGDYVLIFS
ncbi:MAG: hypothetical protein GQ547_07255 [Methylophaga sp.]|nr:hypothetical protein [Methylophaga sp.]